MHTPPTSIALLALLPLTSCMLRLGGHTPPHGAAGHQPLGEGCEEVRGEIDGVGEERSHLMLEIARLRAAEELAAAEFGKALARRTLDSSRRELEDFLRLELPLLLAEQELALSEGRNQLRAAEVELEELKGMYALHPSDPKTAELVLDRARRAAEEARASLAVEERRLVYMVDAELPARERAIREAVDEAEAALMEARAALKLARRSTELDLLDAREEAAGFHAEGEDDPSGGDGGEDHGPEGAGDAQEAEERRP